MIETPIVGRYQGEDRRLIFGPPAIYHSFVIGVGVVGGLFLVTALVPGAPLWPGWWMMVGILTVLASVLAAMSLQLVVFDLKERTYRRRQGPGVLPRQTHGRLDDLDAVVVIAEPSTIALAPSVTYHIVLHWKVGRPEPILVLYQDTRTAQPGLPLNAAAGPALKLGERYAKSLGVKFFDNTYFPSPCPVPIW